MFNMIYEKCKLWFVASRIFMIRNVTASCQLDHKYAAKLPSGRETWLLWQHISWVGREDRCAAKLMRSVKIHHIYFYLMYICILFFLPCSTFAIIHILYCTICFLSVQNSNWVVTDVFRATHSHKSSIGNIWLDIFFCVARTWYSLIPRTMSFDRDIHTIYFWPMKVLAIQRHVTCYI